MTHKNNIYVWAAILLCCQSAFAVYPPKLLHSGWTTPDTRYFNQNIDEFKTLPFSGSFVTVSYPQNPTGSVLGGAHPTDSLSWSVFQVDPPVITDAMVSSAISDLQVTNFSGVPDNFLHVVSYPRNPGWDWFDDTAWNKVLTNVGQMAKVAYQGNLQGISFDPEEYGVPMWSWGGNRPGYRLADLPEYAGRTWTQTHDKVYQRGLSFGQAMTLEYPGIDVWTLYGYSHIIRDLDPATTPDLSDTNNGLYAAFLDGMLSGTNSDSTVIDGGEPAYRYSEPAEFAYLRNVIKDDALDYTADPALYAEKMRVGFGLYMDMYKYPTSHPWYSDQPENNYMTPARLETALRNAITASDGYVWIYSENPSWWLTGPGDTFGEDVVFFEDENHGWVDQAYHQAMRDALAATMPVAPDGLIAYFPFDSVSGGVTPNAVDGSNNGTVTGTTLITGRYGNALEFNGTSDKVDVAGGLSALNGATNQVSIAFWIKGNADEVVETGSYAPIVVGNNTDAIDMQIVFKGTGGDNVYALWDVPQLRLLPSPIIDRDLVADVDSDDWHHFTFTVDKSLDVGDADFMFMYIDGVLAASGRDAPPYSLANFTWWSIGTNAQESDWLHGALDDLSIWDICLTADQVWALYAYGIALSDFLLGDANHDGLVSADDYASVQANFGHTGTAGGSLLGDANHDGLVSADDYASVQANFGNTSGMSAVPEPATLAFLGIGLTVVLSRRKH